MEAGSAVSAYQTNTLFGNFAVLPDFKILIIKIQKVLVFEARLSCSFLNEAFVCVPLSIYMDFLH